MALSAGALNTRLLAQRRTAGTDDWGSPIQGWQDLGSFSASIRNDTGMGAIRSATGAGIPASIARYSIEVRAEVIRAHGITSADRLVGRLPFSGADTIFSVTGVISDFSDPSHAYILTEVGADER
ncbi:P09 [Xanthomonas phage phiL7]|uniref:p09 n=1 Tax=Xanthomonas phage phiL7 TaxID=538979 RepID=C4ML09_9CAUD|nr:P09 [Xanthomonas phage phiL7]ACE75749.1 P09 [Xanthomonas phage phiL7]